MEAKRYTHKFFQVVTSRYLLRVIDKRQEAPKSKVLVMLSGAFKEETHLTRQEAVELRDALSRVLRGMPKAAKETSPNNHGPQSAEAPDVQS